jgi:hypothetical protein
MPATPEIIGAYLAAAGEGHAMPTLRPHVAAIARACLGAYSTLAMSSRSMAKRVQKPKNL